MATEDVFHIGVKLILLDSEGRVLLLRARAHMDAEVYWDVPGGRIQKGEQFKQTLKREVYEEIGLRIDDELLCFVGFELTDVRISVGTNSVGLILLIFKYKCECALQIHLSAEHSSFWWVTPEEAALKRPSGIPPNVFQKIAQDDI